MAAAAAAPSLPAGRLCTSPSTITPASPSPACCPTNKAKPPLPSCAPLSPSTPNTASSFADCSPNSPTAHRQRLLLSLPPLPHRLPPTRHPAPLHPPLHAAHQRQGRTLHPNRPARVGLRSPLPQLRRTRSAAFPLDRALQLPPSAW